MLKRKSLLFRGIVIGCPIAQGAATILGQIINIKDNGNAKLGASYLLIFFPLFLMEEKMTLMQYKRTNKKGPD